MYTDIYIVATLGGFDKSMQVLTKLRKFLEFKAPSRVYDYLHQCSAFNKRLTMYTDIYIVATLGGFDKLMQVLTKLCKYLELKAPSRVYDYLNKCSTFCPNQ